jgi:phosphoglycolate phosphatase-like HAD superfamily hydrolase
MVLHAAQKLDVEPVRMAVVGDTRVDMQMAATAGAFPVAVVYPDSSEAMISLAGASIGSIADIRIEEG